MIYVDLFFFSFFFRGGKPIKEGRRKGETGKCEGKRIAYLSDCLYLSDGKEARELNNS